MIPSEMLPLNRNESAPRWQRCHRTSARLSLPAPASGRLDRSRARRRHRARPGVRDRIIDPVDAGQLRGSSMGDGRANARSTPPCRRGPAELAVAPGLLAGAAPLWSAGINPACRRLDRLARPAKRNQLCAIARSSARASSVETVLANARHSRARRRYSSALVRVTSPRPLGQATVPT
jgi:hypothetical protein